MTVCEARKKYRAYRSWESMKRRCNSSKYKGYHRYGGRGITYAPVWEDFYAFLADMGERPEGMSIDRIDTDGDYTPENCRWTTPLEQIKNASGFNNYVNIYWSKERKKWVADIGRRSGKKRRVKRFNTKGEAQAYAYVNS